MDQIDEGDERTSDDWAECFGFWIYEAHRSLV
jgi:hypothetical protein